MACIPSPAYFGAFFGIALTCVAGAYLAILPFRRRVLKELGNPEGHGPVKIGMMLDLRHFPDWIPSPHKSRPRSGGAL